ncbi:MAG: ribonuclease HII [Deltaproteobacteria bacterium]|nr:ribonuclease HII [Deltaproteobacteria bacterium]
MAGRGKGKAQPGLFGAADPAASGRKPQIGEVEQALRREGIWPVVGTDEVGRGPLFGPVVAAAVCLRDGARLPGLDDSKKLTEADREALVPKIEAQALAYAVVFASAEVIAERNILGASMLAMRQAVEQVLAQLRADGAPAPRLVLVDGNRAIPGLQAAQRPIIKGDARSRAIAAASILAKVARDRHIVALDADYPGYGLAQHKGYPTPVHLQALRRLGPTPEHRRGFAPVDAAWAAKEQR